MKWLLFLLLIGAAYIGYLHRADIESRISEFRRGHPLPAAVAAPGVAATPEIPSSIEEPTLTPKSETKHLAPAGIFYMTKRVTVTTPDGVVALNPADKVTLVQKLPGDRMKVSNGSATLEISASQATNDLDLAREVEKQEFVAHGGKL